MRSAFEAPRAEYRPLTNWWWSGEPLDEERLFWQLAQIHSMGCGGVLLASLAPFGPAGGSVGDEPRLDTPEREHLLRAVLERCRTLGLGVIVVGPFQSGGLKDINRLLLQHSDYRAEVVRADGRVLPFGFDLGNPLATRELIGPNTIAGRLYAIYADYPDVVRAVFEDEVWPFALWSPGFAEEYRELRGEDPAPWPFVAGDDPALPARRWSHWDVARARAERAYTEPYRALLDRHGLLGGYDQMSRRGTPILSIGYYLDPFRVMAWADAPGTDQMGDVRFHLAIATLTGAHRVWLEGFHSHGQGFGLGHTAAHVFEWAREGASLFLPHGMYYSSRGLWWEWAQPEMGWRQPFSRHYRPFADLVGRVMTVAAAGRHVPEVAVLYPTSTIWADTVGFWSWGDRAKRAESVYIDLMGVHGAPDWDRPEVWQRPSVLAEAFYDRTVVNEDWLDRIAPDLPMVLPACTCLPTPVLEALVERAERGGTVVAVEPLPEWSAENGRGDDAFLALAERLRRAATVVAEAKEVPAALPPARAEGLKSQWRRVGDLDLLLVSGTGRLRLPGLGPRRLERWDFRSGTIEAMPALLEGDDLLIDLHGPFTVLSLAPGEPEPPVTRTFQELPLPEVWEIEYIPWDDNRWGDLRLPPNPGPAPVERRTFAWREGDSEGWERAPVVPEDVQQPTFELGFEDMMRQAQGRARPAERRLPDGWREVVSTFGPHGTVDGEALEYSERYGVEDLLLETPLGLRGFVEPWKVDLGDRGGVVESHAFVDSARETTLVVECTGVMSVALDGAHLIGPVEGGLLAIPVSLEPGWHHLKLQLTPREVSLPAYRGYRPAPRVKATWAFMEPNRRPATTIWGGFMMHPDYRGSNEARRFRRQVRLPERARVVVRSHATAPHTFAVPEWLDPGEHELEALVAAPVASPGFQAEIEFQMERATLWIKTDSFWESCGPDDSWEAVTDIGAASPLSGREGDEEGLRPSPLLDVDWLHGEGASAGHAETLWADSTAPPPPSWFCFLAPPGAQAITLPIDGDVQAWLDGVPAEIQEGLLPLTEGARVALRVQAGPGRRGAACFREHPVLHLGPGTIRTGTSWHRQGLDCFAGVILHRARVAADRECTGILDLGSVISSVAVRVNGTDAGTIVCEPWQLAVPLRLGENLIELEVAGTLGPLVGRGVPTPFGPEAQRFCGILGRPRLLVPPAGEPPGGAT